MPVGSTPLRCVIIDDNPDFIVAAADVLESDGVTVVGETTAAAGALGCVEALAPDVALIDVDLGSENGFDLAEQLHRRDGVRPALIMMSAHDPHDLIDLVAASPAVGFIPKLSLSATAIREMLADR